MDSIYVVGMHHYGSRNLGVGEGFSLTPQPQNPYDHQALAVTKNQQVYGHIIKCHAGKLFTAVSMYAMQALVKVKGEVEIVSQREGPRQRVTVGLKVHDKDYEGLKSSLMKSGLIVRE